VLKFDSISKFFDSILDGTATLTPLDSQVPEDSHKLSPEEEEIESKQEAQRLALLHGGYTDMIDFEKAIKKYGTGFHGAHGYNAPPDETSNDQTGISSKGGEDWHEREEDPIHRAIRIQRENEEAKWEKNGLQDSPSASDKDQVPESHMATGTAPLSTATKLNPAPQASPHPGISISGSIVGVPSDAPSPSETEAVPTHRGTTAPETVHIKDEL
jgi:protein disulfide-isomerase A6